MKENCYKCKHKGSVPGSCHSSCNHPEAGLKGDPGGEILAIFASVGRVAPVTKNTKKLNIRGSLHGMKNGWFNWPFDFDPIWLENCDGFENKVDTVSNVVSQESNDIRPSE